MTLKEYNKLNETAIKQQEEARQTDLKYHIENADEIAAKYKREQYKKYQTITQEPKEKLTESSSRQYSDEYGKCSIGEWQVVEEHHVERKAVDLELPKQNHVYCAVANVKTDEPPIKKFKEKTLVGSIDSNEIPSVFKKRKIGNRNIRRTNDDS